MVYMTGFLQFQIKMGEMLGWAFIMLCCGWLPGPLLWVARVVGVGV